MEGSATMTPVPQHIEGKAHCRAGIRKNGITVECKSTQFNVMEIYDSDGEETVLSMRIVCKKCGDVYYTDEVDT
jgi:hypothetical protein